MKKSTIRGNVGWGILLVLYILIAFLIPFVHTATFWVSLVFTMIAFCVVAVSFYIAFIKNSDAKSKFYGFPIAKIGVSYGLIQLIVGLLLMAFSQWVPVWVAVLVYAVGLGATVIGLISAEAVVEEIKTQDAKLKKNVTTMRSLQSKVRQLAAQYDHPQLKKLAEEIRYSDPVSSDALMEIEADLSDLINQLQLAVVQGDSDDTAILCRKATATLNERNRLCKLNKQ